MADFTDTIPFLLGSINNTGGFAASATQTQGEGQLTKGFTDVDEITSELDVVTLPPAEPNIIAVVQNSDAAQKLQLFPSSGDRVDVEATDASIVIHSGQIVWFWAIDSFTWVTWGRDVRGADSYSASATQTQAGGTSIVTEVADIVTVTTNDDAVTLFPVFFGSKCIIKNSDPGQRLKLFPASGDQIDTVGVTDEPITVPAGVSVLLFGVTNARWMAINVGESADSVTAFAGGGQADATLLTAEYNSVGTVATNGDSVKLPDARPGLFRAVYNDDSSQYLECFPNSNDRLNDQVNDTGILISPNSGVLFYCVSTALWHTFARDLPYVNSFAASGTQSQGNGAVQNGFTRISSVSVNGDAITLPAAYTGNDCTLFNNDSAQYAQVFPASGNSINSLGTDQPLLLFPGQTVYLRASSAANWYAPPAILRSVVNGVIANGNVIGTATQLLGDRNVIGTSTASDNAVQLPTAYAGRKVWIHNDDNVDAVLIFPKSGESASIDDEATDASVSLAVNATIELRALSASKWRSNIT